MALTFSEQDYFFEALDRAVKEDAGSVVVQFPGGLPDQNSKLWRRLRRCANWSEIESELDAVRAGRDSPIRAFMAAGMVAGLTGGEIILIAWIATLLAGIIFYAIYKKRVVVLDGRSKPPRLVLKVI